MYLILKALHRDSYHYHVLCHHSHYDARLLSDQSYPLLEKWLGERNGAARKRAEGNEIEQKMKILNLYPKT